MNKESGTPSVEEHLSVAGGILRRTTTVAVFLVLIAVILFLTAGRLNWIWAWVYLAISLLTVLINGAFMLRTNPGAIAERARLLQGTEEWDRAIGSLWAVAIYFALPLMAGLDVRFGWTRALSVTWHVAGAVLLAAGLGLSAWAMIANAYFSTAVRIQSDRSHTVCRTGPYQFVRHPGYVGFILQSISVPFLLGSLWALIPGIIATILMIIRTSPEDRLLQAELPGYQDYVQEVRYRLVPGIW